MNVRHRKMTEINNTNSDDDTISDLNFLQFPPDVYIHPHQSIGRPTWQIDDDWLPPGFANHIWDGYVEPELPEVPEVMYNYKLCSSFGEIRQFLEEADYAGFIEYKRRIILKSIIAVENRDNGYTAEFTFSSPSELDTIQEIVDACRMEDHTALIPLGKE